MIAENKEVIVVKIACVLKDIPENKISTIPNCCGAYVIKVNSGKLYVGSSKTLRNRISQHKGKLDPNISTSDKIRSTCYYETHTHVEARIIEHWLIREINPELNKTNNSNILKNNCSTKCSKNCVVWDSSTKSIKFDVKIIGACENITKDKLASLPKSSGVYAITTESGELYVGSSTNIQSRVKEHGTLKGENVKEPIKSVNYYITENRTDAYILEYYKIRELSPKLNREFKDDAWTWKSGELSKHFEKRPELKELFKVFSSRIRCCVPEIEEVVRKDRVTYKTVHSKHIFFIKFMSGYLRVDLKDENYEINDSSGFSWEIKPKQSDIFHRQFKLSNISEIDKALKIIKESHDKIK